MKRIIFIIKEMILLKSIHALSCFSENTSAVLDEATDQLIITVYPLTVEEDSYLHSACLRFHNHEMMTEASIGTVNFASKSGFDVVRFVMD